MSLVGMVYFCKSCLWFICMRDIRGIDCMILCGMFYMRKRIWRPRVDSMINVYDAVCKNVFYLCRRFAIISRRGIHCASRLHLYLLIHRVARQKRGEKE